MIQERLDVPTQRYVPSMAIDYVTHENLGRR